MVVFCRVKRLSVVKKMIVLVEICYLYDFQYVACVQGGFLSVMLFTRVNLVVRVGRPAIGSVSV